MTKKTKSTEKKTKSDNDIMKEAMNGFMKEYGGAVTSKQQTEEELYETLMNVQSISTGSLALDDALGIWGFPKGRVVELYGAEHSGKTSIALQCAGCCQKKGGKVMFLDIEHALDPLFSMQNGADYSKMMHIQPDSGDDAMNMLDYWLRANKKATSPLFDVIIVDSVAALVTEGQLKNAIGKADVAVGARLLSQTMRKITPLLGQTLVIFINQIRSNVGVMFGPDKTTPGGKALKFYSSVRCDVSKAGAIYLASDGSYVDYSSNKKKIREIGRNVRVKIDKNKLAPKGFVAEFEFVEGEGILRHKELLTLGLKYGIIEQGGAYYTMPGYDKKINGTDAAAREIKENPALQQAILNQIKTIVFNKRKTLVEEQIAKLSVENTVFDIWSNDIPDLFNEPETKEGKPRNKSKSKK